MEERLQKLEAEADLRRLIVGYANTLDARDYKGYVQLFAEDGEWVGGLGAHKGRAAIEKMLVEGIGTFDPGYVNASNFHMTANPYVEVDGDKATATSMFLFWVRSGGDKPVPQPAMAGRYYDEFAKINGEWKITKRVAHNWIPWQDPINHAPDPAAGTASARLTPNSVEARLQKVEDQQAIQRLLIEYSARLDAKDIAGWVDVFTEDGTWRNGPNQVHKGPEQLRALLMRLFGGEPPIDYMQGQSYQVIHGFRIDVDGDEATSVSRHTLFQRGEDGSPRPVLAGIYHDKLKRVNGQWKIYFRDDFPVIPSREEWEVKLGARRAPVPE